MPSPSTAALSYTATVTTAEKRVFDLAMALTPEERLRVAEAILDATPHESREDIEAAWFEEACRRVDMLQRGEMLAHDGEQVLAAIEASLRMAREQRELLVAVLSSEVDESAEPTDLEVAWDEEIRVRMEEIRSGKVAPVPWAEAKLRLSKAR